MEFFFLLKFLKYIYKYMIVIYDYLLYMKVNYKCIFIIFCVNESYYIMRILFINKKRIFGVLKIYFKCL